MAENNNLVFLGTEIKLNVHIEPIDGITMEDYNFTIEAFCSSKNILSIGKTDAIQVEGSTDDYIILIDTTKVGTGILKLKVIAEIPDGDFMDQYRTEVSIVDTGINIVKSI